MSKHFTKTLLASAFFGLLASASASASASSPSPIGVYSVYQGDNDSDQTSSVGLSSAKYKIVIHTETGKGAIFYGNNSDISANNGKMILAFDAQGHVTTLADGTTVKIHNADLAEFVRSVMDGNATNVKDVHNMSEGEVRSLIQDVEARVAARGEIESTIATNASAIEKLNKDTTFAIDADGNITLDEAAGTGERYGVKDVVAEVVEDTTVRVAEDGSLTTARNTQTTKRVNEAVVDLDKSVRTNSQDIATNRKAIQSNSRQLQEHNARLNDHQRQIRENHEEMKRAAAQSAALAGLFQPYSVGKFNATAA
ncbi:TPA: hypothetical protein PJF95_005116, partial [Escherichia coli]|nr:hypothetical protein [Escherichia coli]